MSRQTEKLEIAKRLRRFGEDEFTTMAAFAAKLEMKPQALNNYLNGLTGVGGEIQSRLRALGCDIEWLTTGVRSEDAAVAKSDAEVEKLREKVEELEEKASVYDVMKEIMLKHEGLRGYVLAKKLMFLHRPAATPRQRQMATAS